MQDNSPKKPVNVPGGPPISTETEEEKHYSRGYSKGILMRFAGKNKPPFSLTTYGFQPLATAYWRGARDGWESAVVWMGSEHKGGSS